MAGLERGIILVPAPNSTGFYWFVKSMTGKTSHVLGNIGGYYRHTTGLLVPKLHLGTSSGASRGCVPKYNLGTSDGGRGVVERMTGICCGGMSVGRSGGVLWNG